MRGHSPLGLVRRERINHILYCMNYQPGSCAHSQGYGHRDRRMRLDCRQGQSIMSSAPGVHKSRASKLCTMAPNFCGFTVWCLFHVTILAPGTVWWFQKKKILENLCSHSLHSVHIGCGVYCTSYKMDTRIKTAGALNLTIHVLLVKLKQSFYRP